MLISTDLSQITTLKITSDQPLMLVIAEQSLSLALQTSSGQKNSIHIVTGVVVITENFWLKVRNMLPETEDRGQHVTN